jgi:hypothetical protein
MAMIFDTGGYTTTLLKPALKAYYAQVPTAQDTSGGFGRSYGIPCNTTLPDLTYIFNADNVSVTVPGHYFKQDNGDGSALILTSAWLECRFLTSLLACSSIITIEETSPRGSCGSPFFFSQFVIFNTQSATMSFAPQAPGTPSSRYFGSLLFIAYAIRWLANSIQVALLTGP